MMPEILDLETISERLERVERQNRRMKQIWLITWALAILAVGSTLGATFSAASAAQGKKEVSPFEKYLHSGANELAVRKIRFDMSALRQSIPFQKGIGFPTIEGISDDGKLIIQVEVLSSQLPRTIDARKEALNEAVGVAMSGYVDAFGPVPVSDFDKTTRIAFFDDETLLKSTVAAPLDPVIATYENKELTFH